MEKVFYKLIDNIDFVWKVEVLSNDPYKEDEFTYGQYVCNKRVFNPRLFENVANFEQGEHLSTYTEIIPDQLNEKKCYYDKTIGLMHADDYWNNLYALRHVNFINQLVPIVFDSSNEQRLFVTEVDKEIYLKLLSCSTEKGQEVYECAYQYFKTLWDFDAHFAKTNLDTIEKFLPTIELQAIYLKPAKDGNEASATVVFRPSWDPEIGLAIVINLATMTVKLYEDS